MPQPDQNREREGERERIERVEERRAAHDDAGFGAPAGKRHALNPRDQAGCVDCTGVQIRPSSEISWTATSSGRSMGVRWRAPLITVSVEFGMAWWSCSAAEMGVA